MTKTFEQIKNDTFGMRGSFSEAEREGTKGFVEHMAAAGHDYSIHPVMLENYDAYANEGFMVLHTGNPALGVVFVKLEAGRGLFRKKYAYHMFLDPGSRLEKCTKQYEYPKYFKALPNVALLREGMKIED